MKRIYPLIIIVPGLLWLAGCGQTQPDILENIFFTDDEEWLDRNDEDDPYELVGGRCCNDYLPYPLPLDDTIQAVIDPARDLDYFAIHIADSACGQLRLLSKQDNIMMRLFNPTLEEYDFVVETLTILPESFLWTNLLGSGSDTSFTVLIAGDSDKSQGTYNLTWEPVVLAATLFIETPLGSTRWRRSEAHAIRWSYSGIRSVSLALLKGPVIIDILERDAPDEKIFWWTPSEDLEPGDDYRIMIFFTSEPERMNISDVFQID